MAELIMGSVLNSVTEHLITLVSGEIELAQGVKPELQKLCSTVSVIRGKLREAEKRQIIEEDLKEWLIQLKDVLYDADDLLDDFSAKVLRRVTASGRGKRIMQFFSSTNRFEYARKMAHKVQEIRERINSILDDGDRLQVGSSNLGVEKLFIRPQTHAFKSEPFLIGRDKDKKKVVEFLLNPDFEDNVTIFPIVGVGGLGKTTLARLAFNEESVQEYFELKLWLCVSTDFDMESILTKIVQTIVKEERIKVNRDDSESAKKDIRKITQEYTLRKETTKSSKIDELQKKLREELDGKRFLLVLDDVWNENRRKWLDLEEYLKKGAKGSKILVTTRSLLVADTMKARPHYQLSGLPEDKSLSLLMLMAGKQESEWKHSSLERIAKEILRKCAGVPLAIMTIGRLLVSRNTEEDGLKFKNNEISRIDQEEGDIMPTLRMSYDFLPFHLKSCFSYCCLFPKDYELKPDELVHLWMAQGFIKASTNRLTIEEAGHNYFLELLSRSFFQDVEYDLFGNIERCKMHDLIHDLAVSVAGDDYVTIDVSHMNEFPDGARHVSILAEKDYKWTGFDRDNGRVRSLFLMAIKPIEIGCLDVSGFKNLRSLRLRNVGITKISRSIGKMEHLRSLDLSWNDELRSLPNSINKLRNLETLNLTGCWDLERLPRNITKLVNLRKLDVRQCYKLKHMPRGIGKLTNLRILSTFVVGQKWNPKAANCNELCKLVRLRNVLSIRRLNRLGSVSGELEASLTIEKLALQSLELHWDDYFSKNILESPLSLAEKDDLRKVLETLRPHRDLKELAIEGYPGDSLPLWFSQLDKLVHIKIQVPGVRQLPQLEQLRFLKRISVTDSESLESIELSGSAAEQSTLFPSLEEIELEDLPKFVGWKRNRGEDEMDEQDSNNNDSLWMLPKFSDKVKVSVKGCRNFSYSHGQQVLKLSITTEKMLQQLLGKNIATASPVSEIEPATSSGMMTMIPISSISFSMLTSLVLTEMKDVESLSVALFQPLSSLQSLEIVDCKSLKALSVSAILRCLPNLEKLEISSCEELSIEDEAVDDGDGIQNQLQGHYKLSHIIIEGIPKMEALPGWFEYLSILKILEIKRCNGLKSLQAGRQFLPLLTTLESLMIERCEELDLLMVEPEELKGTANLRHLTLDAIYKMETFPRWMQRLTSMESVTILSCGNLKALPEWFSSLTSLETLTIFEDGKRLKKRCQKHTGKDWPKISHIPNVNIYHS